LDKQLFLQKLAGLASCSQNWAELGRTGPELAELAAPTLNPQT